MDVTCMHAYAHTYTHTHMHTRAHVHTYTHAQVARMDAVEGCTALLLDSFMQVGVHVCMCLILD